ncbi:MAG: thiosulfate/3-mercaptopyruvate sulfurtransferase [Motiliproteus sp.]|jgi:thiosulfate/3-mercaptopyruvate sulfurtransferase
MDYRNLIDAPSLEAGLNSAASGRKRVVLDCRFNLLQPDAGVGLYRQGHIPGALYAHLDNDLSSPITASSGRHPLPDPKVLARRLGEWGIGPDTQVVVYDDMGGAIAARAWWLLRELGHERVAVLDGGFQAWVATEGAVSGEPVAASPCDPYPYSLNRAAVVSAEAVLANIQSPGFTLVDARSPERFRGEQEPIDPVAGHIPGSLNRPLAENLTANGHFKAADILRAEWLTLLGNVPPAAVVTTCGSGAAACHLLLSLEIAGLPGARLYPGSWSEWIRDPARPVATA